MICLLLLFLLFFLCVLFVGLCFRLCQVTALMSHFFLLFFSNFFSTLPKTTVYTYIVLDSVSWTDHKGFCQLPHGTDRDQTVNISKFYIYVLCYIWKSENSQWNEYYYLNKYFELTCNGYYKRQGVAFVAKKCITCDKNVGPNAPTVLKHMIGVHKYG